MAQWTPNTLIGFICSPSSVVLSPPKDGGRLLLSFVQSNRYVAYDSTALWPMSHPLPDSSPDVHFASDSSGNPDLHGKHRAHISQLCNRMAFLPVLPANTSGLAF